MQAALRVDLDLAGDIPRFDGLSITYLEYHALLPVGERDSRLVVACGGELDPTVCDDLRLLFGYEPHPVAARREDVLSAIQRIYGSAPGTAQDLVSDLSAPDAAIDPHASIEDLREQANEAPVIRLMNLLLLEAVQAGASDIHLEIVRGGMTVRYRIDGVLQNAPTPPLRLVPALVSRIKIMADLDIAERRRPQDGRIRVRVGTHAVDVRVATMPVAHGENLVLRLLDRGGSRPMLGQLGMTGTMLDAFRTLLAKPTGIILITGPTGSGKTTTLYAALEHLRTGREKIATIEDPIEYEIDGISQTPVSTKTGFGFADALRAVLRQDPDIVLVGEIRDPETAQIATQAALTGHLVLSTLHTNDAAGATVRMLDLGVPPYLLSSTLTAVLAQRLVRRPCPCRSTAAQTAESGCSRCRGTGYAGRVGIYELLVPSSEVRDAILQQRALSELQRIIHNQGGRSMREDGEAKVERGMTDAAELGRVLGA